MAGLIVTAKAFATKLKKNKLAYHRDFMALTDMGHDPGFTVEGRLEQDMNDIAEDFRLQCRLAVKLRNIAIEEGLIKLPEHETPKLENSPVLTDKYALITIRPDINVSLERFTKAIETFVERPWIRGAEYHYEQTGTTIDTMGKGFHCHILAKCKKSIRVTEIIETAAADLEFKYSIEIGNNRNKFLKTAKDLEYVENYIRGDKHSSEKREAVDLNEAWLDSVGLQNGYYIKDMNNRESRPDAVIIEELID